MNVLVVNNGKREFPENLYIAEGLSRVGHSVDVVKTYTGQCPDLTLFTIPQARCEEDLSGLWSSLYSITSTKVVLVHGDFKGIYNKYPDDVLIFKTNFSGGYGSNVIPLPKTPLSWSCSKRFDLLDRPVGSGTELILFIIGSVWSGSRLVLADKLKQCYLEGYTVEIVSSLPLEEYISKIDNSLFIVCCNGNIESEPDEGDDWKVGESLMRGTPVLKCNNGVVASINDPRSYREFNWNDSLCDKLLEFANNCHRDKTIVKHEFDAVYGLEAMAEYIIKETVRFNGNREIQRYS